MKQPNNKSRKINLKVVIVLFLILIATLGIMLGVSLAAFGDRVVIEGSLTKSAIVNLFNLIR